MQIITLISIAYVNTTHITTKLLTAKVNANKVLPLAAMTAGFNICFKYVNPMTLTTPERYNREKIKKYTTINIT